MEKHASELEKKGDANCSKIKNAMNEMKVNHDLIVNLT